MTARMRRIAAGLVALLFLIGAGLLYRAEFVSLRTEQQRQEAAEAYTRLSGLTVFGDETVRGRRILAFADGGGTLGSVQFRRGLLGGWQAVSAGYSTGDAIGTDRLRDVDALAVYAADCPPEVARYRVQANLENEETLMAKGDVTTPSFLHIYETDRDYFPAIHLYGANGAELDRAAYQGSGGSTGVGGERNQSALPDRRELFFKWTQRLPPGSASNPTLSSSSSATAWIMADWISQTSAALRVPLKESGAGEWFS